MADVAWVSLTIWPWDESWLDADDELREEFDEAGLVDTLHGKMGEAISYALRPAMNGDIDFREEDCPDGRTVQVAVVSGEMRGGSYQIREETSLLECLRERNIAFVLTGDAKYEWDGDECWWYPGRDEVFYSTAGEGGRFLDQGDFAALRVRSLTVSERVALLDTFIGECQAKIEAAQAADRNRAAAGEPPVGENVVRIYTEAVANHLIQKSRLLDERPEPEDLGALVAEWFAHEPLAWRPDVDWAPKLKLDEEGDPS